MAQPVAHIGCMITGPVADKRHDVVDETRTHDLAAPPGCVDRSTLRIEQLEVAIGRPDMVVRRVLAFGCQDELFRVPVA